ncbi:MAG: BrxA/BrxB family bacilliredoxin [Ignavibacteriaceae bacterium]|nr:BrxA/BrxB family bacilliredoxin [Ignavibacteria bacterium]NNJ52381.1 BrxA/BrxB family bacilliredoxin [Ignavibacteriaceae bacterium]
MFNISSRTPMYDQNAVQPMRDELKAVGFTELLNAKEVDEAIKQNNNETVLVMINSVCGCAAGSARPGISLALQNDIIPDRLYTGFAGQERDAVDRIRELIGNQPPSSPSVALFKNGEIIHMMHRQEIEGRMPQEISNDWRKLFDEKCEKKGPSISPEQFEKVMHAKACGSKIPLYNE